MGHPLTLTVVVPVFNRVALLAESLESIAAQTHPADQILVVDGGSTDGTQSVAAGFAAVRLIEAPGTNVPAAFNIGIGEASGEIVAFASSDDLMEPTAIERHLSALAARPECGMSVGLTAFFADDPHARTPRDLAGTVRRARLLEAMAVRQRVLKQHGAFTESLGPSADLEWLSRLGDAGVAVVEVDSVVVSKRLHQGNTTYGRDQTAQEVMKAVRATLVRRRTQPS